MRVLIDTHVLLWTLMEPDRLSPVARDLVSDPATALVVSSVSTWEISTKHRLGRLDGAVSVVHGYPAHLERLGAEELPILSSHAILAGSLGGTHRDPFDRMLAAQSLVETIPIVTGDVAISDLGATTIW